MIRIALSIPNIIKHHLHVCCSPAEGNIQSSFTIRGKQHIPHSADAQSKSRNHREGEQVQCEDAEIWWWQKCREQESIGVTLMKLKFKKWIEGCPNEGLLLDASWNILFYCIVLNSAESWYNNLYKRIYKNKSHTFIKMLKINDWWLILKIFKLKIQQNVIKVWHLIMPQWH